MIKTVKSILWLIFILSQLNNCLAGEKTLPPEKQDQQPTSRRSLQGNTERELVRIITNQRLSMASLRGITARINYALMMLANPNQNYFFNFNRMYQEFSHLVLRTDVDTNIGAQVRIILCRLFNYVNHEGPCQNCFLEPIVELMSLITHFDPETDYGARARIIFAEYIFFSPFSSSLLQGAYGNQAISSLEELAHLSTLDDSLGVQARVYLAQIRFLLQPNHASYIYDDAQMISNLISIYRSYPDSSNIGYRARHILFSILSLPEYLYIDQNSALVYSFLLELISTIRSADLLSQTPENRLELFRTRISLAQLNLISPFKESVLSDQELARNLISGLPHFAGTTLGYTAINILAVLRLSQRLDEQTVSIRNLFGALWNIHENHEYTSTQANITRFVLIQMRLNEQISEDALSFEYAREILAFIIDSNNNPRYIQIAQSMMNDVIEALEYLDVNEGFESQVILSLPLVREGFTGLYEKERRQTRSLSVSSLYTLPLIREGFTGFWEKETLIKFK